MADEKTRQLHEPDIEQLLALANLQRMRGQWAEVEVTLRKASEIVPEDPTVIEMLGDALFECGKVAEARDVYHKGAELHPGKAVFENKYAKMILAIAEAEHERAIAQDMLENPQAYLTRERKPGSALLLSLLPGMGQFYNHEIIKACVIWGVMILYFASWAIFQDTKAYIGVNGIGGFISQTNPVVLVLGVLSFIAYVYGMVDAPISADKISKSVRKRIEG